MSDPIKRSRFRGFLDISGTPETPDYALMADGIAAGEIAFNPNVTSEIFLHQDNATPNIDSYAPTLPFDAQYRAGDDVLDYLEGLQRVPPVGADAFSSYVSVYLYETPVGSEYPAVKRDCSIQFDNYGGDAGVPIRIKGTLLFSGDPVVGTFDPETGEFTPGS